MRDAQRNARDTEILVTLVRSAAEMRNSFEDMKKFITDQDEMVVDVGNKQHEKTQRVIGGPRPQPLSAPRTPRRASAEDEEELGAKRRNVFRRALKGLSGRNTNDLAKIELMMNRLLDEVADLKAGQDERPTSRTPLANGYSSYEQLRDVAQDGYEPEGQAGTSSTGDQSGYFSNPPSRQGSRPSGYDRRHASGNRVSTVMEEHEEGDELEPHEQEVLDYEDDDLTPTRERGASVPLDTPPTAHLKEATQSADNTPRTDKSRKHKSSSSSFFPKMASRWSKTTASSVVDNLRGSTRKERPISGVSQTGSEDVGAYDTSAHYDPQGDDRLRSNTSFNREAAGTPTDERYQHQAARPPSPLVPSQVSHISDKPQYKSYRDSMDFHHPQPRPGPTARYQNRLESQVRDDRGSASSPMSPNSDQFGSNPVLARFGGMSAGNRLSGGAKPLSPISDRGDPAPPRPPKVRDDGPLIPPKEPLEGHAGNAASFAERASAPVESPVSSTLFPESVARVQTLTDIRQSNGAARNPRGAVPTRKPIGPRPQTTSGSYGPDGVPRTRYRGSPNPLGSSAEDVTF